MLKYNHQKIEKYWQQKWLKEKIYEPDLKTPRGRGKFYNLMMFPYPSAEGLHVGNVYAFTGSDIYGRYQRMRGYDVFEPIGLDGFGIHSENYALKIGKHPADQAKISEKRFYKQLESIGNGFAWEEKLETYDPEYYRWTQWIFIQMFKHGLAYRKKASVNWCPSCLTVLADEQAWSGECERCGTKVIKKELEQWFFKITDYAERLLDNLGKINWSERIKTAQRNWIGKSEGALIKFKVQNLKSEIGVFTTRPDTLYGATYMVLAPEHELIRQLKPQIQNWPEVEAYINTAKTKTTEQRSAEGKAKTGVELKGVLAINPANQKEIPVWLADYVLTGYGAGAIMAVPAHDERDAEFARKFNLPFSNAPLADAEEIIRKVGGKKVTTYRLRDWLISRQRYWGPPIPMIYCEKCRWQAVPEKDLPVLLPKTKDFRPTGTDKSPLALVEKFYKTECPKCGGQARRETDVSDTFLDSSWYYLRYPGIGTQNSKIKMQNDKVKFKNGENSEIPWNPETTKIWLPVDIYIGGAEHAVLHLLYVRFVAMALYDWKFINFEEPATKFRAHGLLIKDGAKMSKSRGNVVNPDEYIKKYGADVLRLYLMFLGPFERGGDFRDESVAGMVRFVSRIWQLAEKVKNQKSKVKITNQNSKLDKVLNQSVKKISEDIEKLHYNTAISQLMILSREMEKGFSPGQFEIFLKLLAPFAPHISEEIWRNGLGNKQSIHIAPWPEYDPELIAEEMIDFIVQINGKARGLITLAPNSVEAEVVATAQANANIKKHLAGKAIIKTVFVPNRLVNFVI